MPPSTASRGSCGLERLARQPDALEAKRHLPATISVSAAANQVMPGTMVAGEIANRPMTSNKRPVGAAAERVEDFVERQALGRVVAFDLGARSHRARR